MNLLKYKCGGSKPTTYLHINQKLKVMNNSYSIFCMAMVMEKQNTMELDVWWDKAIELYDEFANSKFNDFNQSELDCMNQFMASKA
jgi:hypothetical protein